MKAVIKTQLVKELSNLIASHREEGDELEYVEFTPNEAHSLIAEIARIDGVRTGFRIHDVMQHDEPVDLLVQDLVQDGSSVAMGWILGDVTLFYSGIRLTVRQDVPTKRREGRFNTSYVAPEPDPASGEVLYNDTNMPDYR